MFTEAEPNAAPPATVRTATDADVRSLLAALRGEQPRLDTPAARAGAAYDRVRTQSKIENPPSAIFRDFIPLTAPSAGEQYAFEVDLDACTGCKACVSACHSLNGLDATESWRDVGLLVSTDSAQPWQQTVTTACHHCAEPACLYGCPVAAYEKDPATGIVRHLDDQCIGCSYCVLKCPYDVPKFNARLGIVRKCDMCHQRLAVGEAPACVQACPTHAIRIVKVSLAPPATASAAIGSPMTVALFGNGHQIGQTVSGADISRFLPAAPDPGYTQPTTRYVSARGFPAYVRAADAGALRPQPAHGPLVAMLTLTQLAIGLLAAAPLPDSTPAGLSELVTYYLTNFPAHTLHLAALAALFAGLGASVLHLGQPLRAWRFFLGLRTSWLSREILVFGAFAPLALATLRWPDSLALRLAALATGALGIACSAMIYIDTRRQFWRPAPTALRMGGTALVAATAFAQPLLGAVLLALKLAGETCALRGSTATARLQRGPLRGAVAARFTFGAAAMALLAFGRPWAAFLPLAAGELAERYLFFRSVDAPKMPGLPASA